MKFCGNQKDKAVSNSSETALGLKPHLNWFLRCLVGRVRGTECETALSVACSEKQWQVQGDFVGAAD